MSFHLKKKIYYDIDPFLDYKGFLLYGYEFLQFLTLISYRLILLFGGTFHYWKIFRLRSHGS